MPRHGLGPGDDGKDIETDPQDIEMTDEPQLLEGGIDDDDDLDIGDTTMASVEFEDIAAPGTQHQESGDDDDRDSMADEPDSKLLNSHVFYFKFQCTFRRFYLEF